MAYPGFVKIDNGWPSIDIGRMRHSVTYLRQVLGTDISGTNISYAADDPPLTGMAAIENMRGTDVIKGGQDTTQQFTTLGMWHQAGIAASGRVQSHNGTIYVIQSVDNVLEMNVVLLLNCVVLGGNGR